MKINKELIIRSIVAFLATVLIVCSGIGVPGILIKRMTDKNKLPSGIVDIAGIHPYGSDTILLEENLLTAVDAFWESQDIMLGDLRTVTKSNAYSEIGIQSGFFESLGSGRPEFLSEVVNVTEEYFPNSIPVSYYAQNYYSAKTDGHEFVRVYNDETVVEIDKTTGIPVYMRLFFNSPYDCIQSDYISSIVEIYADYIGISFVDYEIIEDYSDGYRDSICSIVYTSADGEMVIQVNMNSGWYFTPPNEYSDEWNSTDLTQWDISFYINRAS